MGTCQLLRRGLASSLLFISEWAPLVYSYHLEIVETRKVLSEGGLTEPVVTLMIETTFPRMSVRGLAILRTIDSLIHARCGDPHTGKGFSLILFPVWRAFHTSMSVFPESSPGWGVLNEV